MLLHLDSVDFYATADITQYYTQIYTGGSFARTGA